jgi:copper/silver efflux system protein
VLERLTDSVAQAIKTDVRTAGMTASVATDRAVGGSYLDVAIDREAIARYGLLVADVQEAVTTALGGRTVTFTVEGLERYGVQLRYARELRDDPAAIARVLVSTPSGSQVPLAELAKLVERNGPPMIKSENARPSSWIYVVPVGSDMGGYVAAAKQVVADHVQMPPGYSVAFSGQYEYMLEANRRLSIAIPLAAAAIVLLLFLGTRSWLQTGIVLLAVPFSLIGAVWLLWALGFNTSVAVWVGVIALAGLDAETGLVMLHFLQDSCKRFAAEGRLNTPQDLYAAVHDGAVKRIRPKTMTVLVAFTGLLPLLFAQGAGADTMRRLAAPMLGGLTTSFLMELVIYPVIWYSVMQRRLPQASSAANPVAAMPASPPADR